MTKISDSVILTIFQPLYTFGTDTFKIEHEVSNFLVNGLVKESLKHALFCNNMRSCI